MPHQNKVEFKVENPITFADHLCLWLKGFDHGLVLRSNNYQYKSAVMADLKRFELLAGLGATRILNPAQNRLEGLKEYDAKGMGWLFGYLGYDLKNEIERGLVSENPDGLDFPDMYFFEPAMVFALRGNLLTVHYDNDFVQEASVRKGIDQIMSYVYQASPLNPIPSFIGRFSPTEYVDTIESVKRRIARGDIYELNLCQEFYAEGAAIDPYETFLGMNSRSQTSFSALGRFGSNFLMCASPERYLQRRGNRLVSQPIKGTTRRGSTPTEDELLKSHLASSTKERAENVMIVDLVRNDLARIALRGSVRVDELCRVYPFMQVSQLISTVSCRIPNHLHAADAIRSTFPMGSMTGAPKIRAMELIEHYERSKRGLFSGAVGYITPQGEFDFNVVIRSLLYSQTKEYLSYSVGSAITALSDPLQEYQECLLKARAIHDGLSLQRI